MPVRESITALLTLEIDTKVTEIFNKANFEVVPAYEVGILPEKFAYDFAALNEISSSTQKKLLI